MGKAGAGQNSRLAWRLHLPFVCLLLLLAACLEFAYFPGHTYLASASQRYAAVLERLDTPGYLSRDLVATHPNVTYTVYDEVTLFVKDALGKDIRSALLIQQFLFRLAALAGLFLLARAAGLDYRFALLVAALCGLACALPGVDPEFSTLEPVPKTFAFGSCLLATGLLARGKPLLAGLFGGVTLLYDAITAVPFWLVILMTFFVARSARPMLRPTFPILLVFALLLANLAQLQPGTSEAQPFFSALPKEIAAITAFRTPEIWVSLWPRKAIYVFCAIWVVGVWATTRISPALNRAARVLFLALPLAGILALPASLLLLDVLRWQEVAKLRPLYTLQFTLVLSLAACLIAGVRAIRAHHTQETSAWFSACALILAVSVARGAPNRNPDVTPLARWAEADTWGGSMFFFADAEHSGDPGIFRAESRRPIWVDWESGAQIDDSPSMAREWFERWQRSMAGPFSAAKLETMLPLPIDYYVLQRKNWIATLNQDRIRAVRPVYADGQFVVYDAGDLRSAPGELRLGRPTR